MNCNFDICYNCMDTDCWFYMNCNIDICYNCMDIDCWFHMNCNIENCEWTWMNIYATYLATNKSSSFVFNAVKEPVYSDIRVYKTSFYYTSFCSLLMKPKTLVYGKMPQISRILLNYKSTYKYKVTIMTDVTYKPMQPMQWRFVVIAGVFSIISIIIMCVQCSYAQAHVSASLCYTYIRWAYLFLVHIWQ